MTIESLREICRKLTAVTEDVKWGADLCFSVGKKIFVAVNLEPPHQVSFKCTPETFGELIERPGIIPAPYMARNMWVQEQALGETLERAELAALVRTSYDLVVAKLPKRLRPNTAENGAGPTGSTPQKEVARPLRSIVRSRFSCRRHLFGAGSAEDLLRAIGPLPIVAVDRTQNVPAADAAYVPLGLDFGHSDADERANQSACGPARAHACERGHYRPRCQQRSDPWNRQQAHTRKPAEHAADCTARHRAGDAALGRLAVHFMTELVCAAVLRQQHGDIAAAESRRTQRLDRALQVGSRRVQAEHSNVFRHAHFPLSTFVT